METLYTILRPGKPPEHEVVDWPTGPSLDQLHALLDPILGTPNFEHVSYLGDDGKGHDMFVDEIGLWKHLSRNEEATRLYRQGWLKHHPETPPEEMNYIVGAAVVFDRGVWF